MTSSDFFPYVSFLTILVTFYILAVALKNDLVKADHPLLSSRFIKVSLSGIFLSALGYLLIPGNAEWWLIFNSSVLLGLLTLAIGYRRQYERIAIDYLDHTHFLTIPTESYREAEGVALRAYKPGCKALVPSDNDLIEIAKNYDLNNYVAVFFRIKKGGLFPRHKHPRQEITHLVTGRAEIIAGKKLLTPRSVFTVPAETVHYFSALEDCIGVSFIEK